MNLRDLLFRFMGRIGARDYLAGFGLNVLGFWFLNTFNSMQLWLVKQYVWPILWLCHLVLGYSVLCLAAKRLRDIGLSVWLLVAPIFIACASILLPTMFSEMVDTQAGTTFFQFVWIGSMLASWALVAFFLWLGLSSRTREALSDS